MSLCIAWVRRTGIDEEICMIADSCFSGGQRFLAAPKIFPLSRQDCAIACAGSTGYSFPVVEHIMRCIELNQKLTDRAADITDFLHTVVDVTNKCLLEELEPEPINKGPEFNMILAGYSWKLKKAQIYEIKYDKRKKVMVSTVQKTIKKIPVAFIGDMTREARYKVFQLLERDGVQEGGIINMQPLEALMDLINDKTNDTRSIGGYPQMVKIYPFMRVLPIGFRMKVRGEKAIVYGGRPLLKYETFPYPIYDLETKEFDYMKTLSGGYELKHEKVVNLPFAK